MNYKYSTLALAIVALLTGCGAEDNKSIGDDNNLYPPIVKGEVTIPALHVGLTAQGAYQYFDPNPAARPEGNSIYSWRDANDTELSAEQTLALTYDLLGDMVEFCVTPVAQGTNTTVGEVICSNPREVLEPLGEKPVAENVQLDNTTPQVGETLTGSYDYTHPDNLEGKTTFAWYADDTQIAGADAKTLELLSSETEKKAVKFCVTPATQADTPVRGDETCSLATDPVDPVSGSVPVAENTAIVGEGFVGAVLTGNYDFVDADGDLEGASKRVWERDGAIIPDATGTTYTAVDSDENTDLTFCVKPISATGNPTDGIEACSAPLSIVKKIEDAPIAADVLASVKSGGIAEAGEVLVSSYTFQHASASEGDSIANWVVGGIDLSSCTVAQGCEYPLTQADVSKVIKFCVTPKTQLGTPGVEACSTDVTVAGIQLTGELEYDKQLFATSVGYTYNGTGEWRVDTITPVGLISDLVQAPTLQAEGPTYTIGVREGTLTDLAWVERSDGLDARNFVGKDVQFCLDTTIGERCVSAADFDDVSGGVYFNNTDSSMRGIEPVRMYVFGSATYHRSLTLAESTLKADADFGANIPTAQNSTVINGIEWATFAHDNAGQKDVLNVCRNLYADSGDWHLPEGYLSRSESALKTYLNNMYSADKGYDNNPPIKGSDSLNNLTKKIITSTYDSTDSDNTLPAKDIYMSRVFGWPTSTDNTKVTDTTPRVTYASATEYISGGNIGKTYIIRFYNVGSSTGNAATDIPLLVSCVK